MIRIEADFNNVDVQGRVRLSTVGALDGIAKHKSELREGLEVVLFVENDFEVRAKLVFDLGMWKGIPDYDTLVYCNEKPGR